MQCLESRNEMSKCEKLIVKVWYEVKLMRIKKRTYEKVKEMGNDQVFRNACCSYYTAEHVARQPCERAE